MIFAKIYPSLELKTVPACCRTPHDAYKSLIKEDDILHRLSGLKFSVGGKVIGAHDRFPEGSGLLILEPWIGLQGGKGGFGSMLRAIGAQIEKTTNREACRDLSGRRLRDINEEKKVKDWISKQSERDREKKQRRKAKLEKLCQETKHEFNDPTYDKQRSEISDKVYEAMEQAMGSSGSTVACGSAKRPNEEDDNSSRKKKLLWTGVDELSDSDSDSSGDGDSDRKLESDSGMELQSETEKSLQPPETDEASRNSTPESSEPKVSSLACETPTLTDETSTISCALPITCNDVETVKLEKSEVSMEVPVGKQADDGGAVGLPGVILQEIEVKEESSQEGRKKFTPKSISPDDIKVEPEVSPIPVEVKLENEPVVIENFESVEALEALGLEILKGELQRRSLKCGGSLSERAKRLFSVRGKSEAEIDTALLAASGGKKKKK